MIDITTVLHDSMAIHNRPPCRVYWGSHGCEFGQGHEGPHECDCCDCFEEITQPDGSTLRVPAHAALHEENGCVAKPPYYGPDTKFYGEDAP